MLIAGMWSNKGIMYNHHTWHNLKNYFCLIKQLFSYFHTLHCLVSIFNQFLCWHHFWRIVLFVTTRIGVRPPKNSPTNPNSPPSIFSRWSRCRNARHSSGTTAMDNKDMTVEGLGRLSLVPRLEWRQFGPPTKIACNPKTRGDCPRFRTDIAVGNVRLPVAPFCSAA
jgi:hypothetical protein